MAPPEEMGYLMMAQNINEFCKIKHNNQSSSVAHEDTIDP